MSERFNIGDRVYVASHGNQQEAVACPVCFGKCKVTIILGDDSRVLLPCGYCGQGIEPPRGTVKEYVARGRVTPRTITSVSANEDVTGLTHEYHSGPFYFTDKNTFATEEEAQAEADRLSAEHKKQEETRAEHIKANVHKTFAWNAGYHRREAKDCRKRAERHDRMAELCKARERS